MNTKKTKIVVLVLALALVLGGVIGGTLAWLVAETPAVTNTFTVGNIDITLTETAATAENNYAPSFKMVPGATIAKDPVVTVVKGSEACWLFVEITANGTGDYLEYAATGLNEAFGAADATNIATWLAE